MSMAYLAQPDEQQKLEWLDGEVFSVLMDGAATDEQLTVGRFAGRHNTARTRTAISSRSLRDARRRTQSRRNRSPT